MKIRIGTKNPAKLAAVHEILQDYPHLADAIVEGEETPSGVSDQPKSIEETVTGAKNRAKSVFHDCDYGVGLESGLMAVPGTKSGYMDVCVCAIYDGKEFHLGLSSAWEIPDKRVTALMLKDGLNMTDAVNKAGLTKNRNIGSGEGVIHLFTKGRLNRTEYTKQALRTALIHLDP